MIIQKSIYSTGIRRTIVLIFFTFSVFVIFSSLLFSRFWLLSSYETTKTRILQDGYRSVIFYLQERQSLLESLAKIFARDPVIAASVARGSSPPAPLVTSWMDDYDLDGVVILDQNDKAVYENVDFSVTPLAKAFVRGDGSDAVSSGFWHAPNDKFWFFVRSSIGTEGLLPDRAGALILGFVVDEHFIAQLSERLKLRIYIFHNTSLFNGQDFTTSALGESLQGSWKGLLYSQEPFAIQKAPGGRSAEDLFLDALLRDFRSDPIGILRIQDETKFLSFPRKEALFLLWSIFLFLGISFFWMIKFLTRHITTPFVKLKVAIHDITSSGDLSKRLPLDAEDEIGGLISEFNRMLETLENLNKKIKNSGEEIAMLYRDLLEQKRFTSEILNIAPSIVLMLLPDGRIKYVNEAIESVSGFKVEESLGRVWFDQFVPFSSRNESRAVFDEIVRGNLEPYRQRESVVLTKDGSERLILWNHSVLRTSAGDVSAVISVGQDTTDLKKMESELFKKINDLERFYKVAVDREKNILSLKNQIRDLKQKLGIEEKKEQIS